VVIYQIINEYGTTVQQQMKQNASVNPTM